jgi:hypothetical protein
VNELQMSMDELFALPVSVDIVTAGRAFGLGRTKAHELARAGDFPCRIMRLGNRYRASRSAIFEALDMDPATPALPRKPSPERGDRAEADLDPSPAA